MNERSAGVFLQLILCINVITAQIRFPDDRYEPQAFDLTRVRPERVAPPFQQSQFISPIQQNYPFPQDFLDYLLPQSQRNYPSQQREENYPSQQTKRNYPSQQREDNYPSQQSQRNYPSQQREDNYSSQQSQRNSPSQQREDNYPSQQSQRNYPSQQREENYPSQQSQRNYPSQQREENYPSQQSQRNYPSQQNQDNYPSQPSHQTSPPRQTRKKPASQQNHQNSTPRQSEENHSSQQNQRDRSIQPSQQHSSSRQGDQNSVSQRSRQNSVSRQNSQNSSPQGRRKNPQQNRHQSTVEDSQKNVAEVVAHSFTKMMLDVNRVAPTTSQFLAQADNVVYGPVTIAGALSLVLLASVGRTFNEVANFLGLSSGAKIQNDPFYAQEEIGRLFAKLETTTGLDIGQHVNFATAIFLQQDYPIRLAYQTASALLYQSNIMNLDFQGNPEMAMDVINTWVSGRTNMKIPDLITEPPPPNTKAIIASVMYFQAAWQFPFFDGGTQWRPFYVNGRKNPSDRMALMMSNGGEFPYHKDSKLAVEIMGFPYKGKATTMYVIMPMESNREKLKELENSITPDDIDYLVNSTKYTEAVVLFPKMKLETVLNLRPTLQRLGVNALFNPQEANLALLSEGISQRYNEAPFVSAPISANSNIRRPPATSPPEELGDRLIFNRFGDSSNCIPMHDPVANVSRCQESTPISNPVPLSTRAGSIPELDELSSLRENLLRNPSLENPGLYADQVIHKVYIDITESGTEAAAATGISLNRSGDRVTFRVDIPFLFFIYHEETKVILFFGSVKSPTPIGARST